jgi:hypothetical protein
MNWCSEASFSPRGNVHCLEEWRGEQRIPPPGDNFTPGDKVHSWGTTSPLLQDNNAKKQKGIFSPYTVSGFDLTTHNSGDGDVTTWPRLQSQNGFPKTKIISRSCLPKASITRTKKERGVPNTNRSDGKIGPIFGCSCNRVCLQKLFLIFRFLLLWLWA